jgi:DNA-binding PadR family transcriptional regulator
VLLELADGKRHGWSLIRNLQQRDGGDRILPANSYRTLRALRDDGFIEEAAGDATEDPAERRQYFSLTTLAMRISRRSRGVGTAGGDACRRRAGREGDES